MFNNRAIPGNIYENRTQRQGPKDVLKLARQLKSLGHDVVRARPEIVISFGGDGSFLWAERTYPGRPEAFSSGTRASA